MYIIIIYSVYHWVDLNGNHNIQNTTLWFFGFYKYRFKFHNHLCCFLHFHFHSFYCLQHIEIPNNKRTTTSYKKNSIHPETFQSYAKCLDLLRMFSFGFFFIVYRLRWRIIEVPDPKSILFALAETITIVYNLVRYSTHDSTHNTKLERIVRAFIPILTK